MIEAILETFAIPQDRAKDLERIIRFRRHVFEVEQQGYDRLFKQARPRMVVFVQNGIEKALLRTARVHRIPTVEVQHGLIGFAHPAYSYSPDIDYEGQSTFPDLFMTFSEYWEKTCFFPVTAHVPVGNDSYSVERVASETRCAAMVIGAKAHHDVLVSWIRGLAALSPDRRLLYKLHPSQKPAAAEISMQLSDLPNVEVLTAPVPAASLFKDVSHVIAISSTVAYEALQAGLGVCILPENNYQFHRDIIDLPGVMVPLTPEELDRAIGTKSAATAPPRFFEPFDSDRARYVLERAMKQGGGQGHIIK
jgi:hypothetical protein